MDAEPIAIIGIGCRFPGACGPQAFWRLLQDGRDAVREVPASRWDREAFYDPDPATPGKMVSRWGGFLDELDRFDAQFFGISPRETSNMDPQQRLLLEVAWEALEDAGLPPEGLARSATGVFIGVSSFDYYELLAADHGNFDAYTGTGNLSAMKANRLSYFFDLTGPSMAIDTACSSSLVAVHLACQSLRTGESSLALAGGVHVLLSPGMSVGYAKGGFMAPDGHCKTFDALADGYVRGEGAGVVVLKRLSLAEAEGDRIYAVVRGSAVNQDGYSNGITAPNPLAQEAVLRAAYRNAGVSPGQVQYVEAHGTGTKLGDPIEMKALAAVLAQERPAGELCAVGSVKTNIGHLEAAAGIAGLIKVALSLAHRQIPPSLHFRTPNPYIPFDRIPLRVQQALGCWPRGSSAALAGVSSFGFGGTNAHVVLAEAPASPAAPYEERTRPTHVLCLSAKTEEALGELAVRYVEYLSDEPEAPIEDVCFTANAGRSHFKHRVAVVSESTPELERHLEALAAGRGGPGLIRGEVGGRSRPSVAFLFTGQCLPQSDIGRQLFLTQPTFRRALERCAEVLRLHGGTPLLEVWHGDASSGADSQLDDGAIREPALFSLLYALSELWSSWGVSPHAVMGLGVGEYVAACVAGVYDLEQALLLSTLRGKALRGSRGAPSTGSDRAPLLERATPGRPRIPLVSSVSGQTMDPAGFEIGYWEAQLHEPAQLSRGMETLRRLGCTVFLGVGTEPLDPPDPSLSGDCCWLPSLSPARTDWQQLLHSLGQLYVRGVSVDWRGFDRDYARRKLALPGYPFQRQRHWLAHPRQEARRTTMDVIEP